MTTCDKTALVLVQDRLEPLGPQTGGRRLTEAQDAHTALDWFAEPFALG